MQCMILFPGRDGRLPSAEELRRAGFVLSSALGREPVGPLALAAEDRQGYGADRGAEHGEPEAEAAQG